MSKATKKRLKNGAEKAEKILNILNQKRNNADVTEFLNTMKFVVGVIEDFTKAKSKDRPPVEDEGVTIEKNLKEYEELLIQIVNTQRFFRFFTSNRVRKKLDQMNATIYKEAFQINNGLIEKKKFSTKKLSKKEIEKQNAKEKERQTECIIDEDGRYLWESHFDQTIMVTWEELLGSMRKIMQVDEEAERQLRYILDNSNTGFVSMYKFADFLNGFGPAKQCVQKVQQILNAEWFHGFLSSQEAERFLEKSPANTFLIRFSKSKAGSFAIAYVDPTQRNSVTHTLITCCPPSGFKIEEAYNRNARGRLFASLMEVTEFYAYLLRYPFRSDLPRLSWFHGDLSSQEAEEILKEEPEGTFLLRFSSKGGFLGISYNSAGEVKHGLIECLPNGFKFDNTPPVYASIMDIINNLSDIFKTPLTVLTYAQSKTATNNLTASIKAQQNPDPNFQQSEYTNFSNILRMTAGMGPAQQPTALPNDAQSPAVPHTSPSNRLSMNSSSGMPSSLGTGSSEGSHSNYGTMPRGLAASNGSKTSLTASSSSQKPSNVEYGNISQFVTMKQQQPANPAPATGGSEYTIIPKINPSQQTPTPVPASGTLPSSSEYDRVPPVNNTSPGTVRQISKSPSTSEFTSGGMPLSLPSPNSSSLLASNTLRSSRNDIQIQPSQPSPSSYGSMPAVPGASGTPPASMRASINTGLQNSPSTEYGTMPTPSKTGSSVLSSSISPPKSNGSFQSAPVNAPESNYAVISRDFGVQSTITPPNKTPSQTSIRSAYNTAPALSPTYAIPSTLSSNNPPASNYGTGPGIGINRVSSDNVVSAQNKHSVLGLAHSSSFTTTSTQPSQPSTGTYKPMSSPSKPIPGTPSPSSSLANALRKNPSGPSILSSSSLESNPITPEYGGLPPTNDQSNPPSKATYTNNIPSLKQPIGADTKARDFINRSALDRSAMLNKKASFQGSADVEYGGLPPTNDLNNSNQRSDQGTRFHQIGGRTASNNSGGDVVEYGGLPPTGGEYDGLPTTDSQDYDGLPADQKSQEYGGLPAEDAFVPSIRSSSNHNNPFREDPEYGGLPSTS